MLARAVGLLGKVSAPKIHGERKQVQSGHCYENNDACRADRLGLIDLSHVRFGKQDIYLG